MLADHYVLGAFCLFGLSTDLKVFTAHSHKNYHIERTRKAYPNKPSTIYWCKDTCSLHRPYAQPNYNNDNNKPNP